MALLMHRSVMIESPSFSAPRTNKIMSRSDVEPTNVAFDLSQTIFQDIVLRSSLQPTLLDTLYKAPHSVRAIFRSLPPLARLYVVRLLYIPRASVAPTLQKYRATLRRRQRALDRHDVAVRALRALRLILPSEQLPPDQAPLRLHETFAANLRRALVFAMPPVFGGPLPDAELCNPAELDAFSADKLENILNFLVESSNGLGLHDNLMKALLNVNILENQRSAMCITSAGFQFLLQNTFAQLWVLVRSLLTTHYSNSYHHALNLIFQLSFACPGRTYSTVNLTEPQQRLLKDLHVIGIVRNITDTTFCPTFVGVRLLSSASRISSGPSDTPTIAKTAGEIDVFVETNFRVYAYTTSTFQINLLALFTHMRYKLPSMVVGHLTRDAVRKALQNGITGNQIIGYLNAHAHPRMRKGVIPPNVSDEIRLWEAEQDRVQTTPAIMVENFSSPGDFELVLAYATEIDAVLWSSRPRKLLIVKKNKYKPFHEFLKSHGLTASM